MKLRGGLLVAGMAFVAVVALLILGRPWDRPATPMPVMDASGGLAPGVRIRIEVLNASNVSGLAGDATEYLRDTGFDVVYYGNAPQVTHDSSSVVDRVGDTRVAEAVAKALGIRNVLSEPDPNLFVDVSVMLGSEWLAPAAATEAAPGARAWWDPRGWFR